MADVFISYSHKDLAAAQAVHDALVGAGWSVWWDPQLRVGDAYDEQIERAHREAGAVIVLWSSWSVKSEWVRAEAEQAANDKKLVSVRLDHARLPLRFRIVQTLDIGDFLGGDPVRKQAILRAVAEALGRPEEQIEVSIRDWMRLVRRATRIAGVVGILACLGFGARVFDLLDIDTRLEMLAMGSRALATAPASEAMIYVPIRDESASHLGPFGARFRCHHARLLERLAEAEARVVAFDFSFEPSDAACDGASPGSATQRFAEAIRAARTRGTSIVLGSFEPGDTAPALRSALTEGELEGGGEIAHLCMSKKARFVVFAPVLVSRDDRATASLAMAAAALYGGFDELRWGPEGRQLLLSREQAASVTSIELTHLRAITARDRTDRCRFFRVGDQVGSIILDLGRRPPDGANLSSIPYAELLEHPERARSRVVLVGTERSEHAALDKVSLAWGSVWGARLHASALWSLLDRSVVQEATAGFQLLFIALSAFAGAVLRLRFRYRPRSRLLLVGAVVGTQVTLVVVSAAFFDTLLEGLYPIVATALAYRVAS